MKRLSLAVFVCYAGLVFGNADTLYKQGASLYKDDPEQAYRLFVQAAEEGNVPAMIGAATCLEHGTVTDADFAKALEWYEKASSHNSLKACEGLARIYASCPDPKFHDGEKAVKFASFLAKKNPRDGDALALLAAAFARSMQFEQAANVQSQACRHSAIEKVDEREVWVERYKQGMPNPPLASETWLLTAADKGSSWAMVQTGIRLMEKGDHLNDMQARIWFARAAEKGSGEAALACGKLYWKGFGGERDAETALQYFVQAEEAEVDGATFWTAYAYCCLRRDYSDLSNALKYFKKLEEQDDPLVSAFIETLSYPGWRKSLQEKDGEALYGLGCSFSTEQKKTHETAYYTDLTKTVPANHPRALVCFIIAAESGHTKSVNRAFLLLNAGETGFPPDPERAEEWARRKKTPGSFSSIKNL